MHRSLGDIEYYRYRAQARKRAKYGHSYRSVYIGRHKRLGV